MNALKYTVVKTLLAHKTCLCIFGRIACIIHRGLIPLRLISLKGPKNYYSGLQGCNSCTKLSSVIQCFSMIQERFKRLAMFNKIPSQKTQNLWEMS